MAKRHTPAGHALLNGQVSRQLPDLPLGYTSMIDMTPAAVERRRRARGLRRDAMIAGVALVVLVVIWIVRT